MELPGAFGPYEKNNNNSLFAKNAKAIKYNEHL